MITGELIMAHRQVMYNMAYKITNDQVRAEDATDTAIEKAWVNRDSYDATKAQPVTWLCQIAKNEALQYVRRSGKLCDLDEYSLEQPEEFDTESHYREVKDRYDQVMDVVATDPYVQKYPGLVEVFVSYYRDEMGESLVEISERFGINCPTLRTVFRRMKLRIMESIDGSVPKSRVLGVRTVDQYTLDGEYVATYKHPSNAAEVNSLGNSGGTYIKLCCNGVRTQYRGFVWKWASGAQNVSVEQEMAVLKEKRTINNARRMVVDQLNDSDEVLGTFDSPKSAAKALGYQHRYAQFVRSCADGKIDRALGFRWQWSMKKKKK